MLAVTCGVALSCSPVVQQPTVAPPSPRATGGTLRVVLPDVGEFFGRFLDPAGDPATLDPHLDPYSSYDTWELLRCCLTRTLLSGNGRATEQGGARMQPDLAAGMPDVSADGLAWTFRLREGLHYGPPLQDVEITAPDVIRGFHRLMSPALAEASYGRDTYQDIVGAQAYLDGEAASISGLESPDRYTLVIRLTKPAGHLGARLALSLAIPIPPSPSDPDAFFGVADGHDDGYGRFLVSSAPYLLEGSERLDFSLPPAEQSAVAGLVPYSRITLVRNPSWDAATDELRLARPDRIELYVAPSMAEAVADLYRGDAQLLLNCCSDPEIEPEIVDAIRADPSWGRVFINDKDFLAGIMMNLAQPPFDDIHVRRSVSYAIDKSRIINLLGGPLRLRTAHHLVPDALEDNLLIDYRPYATSGDAGDLDAAMAEMRQSGYDTNGDGMCDASACRGIRAMARAYGGEAFALVAEAVREDLARIGIDLALDRAADFGDFYAPYDDPAQHAAMYVPLGWSKDYLSPAGFFVGQFYNPVALALVGNGSLVGATPEQLREWGYGSTEVPNLDARIEACLPLTSSAQFECWAALDQYLMEYVVPLVPYGSGVSVVLASRDVIDYVWDQIPGAPSFDRIVIGQP